MDVIKAVQNYVNKMIDEVSDMKVLLLDTETASAKHNPCDRQTPVALIRTNFNRLL